jgi:hypothetical protein
MEETKREKKKSKSKHKSAQSIEPSVASSEYDEERRRRNKMIRRAKKHEKEMAALGLDINGEPLDNYSLSKYPVREWKLTLPGFQGHIALNPLVNLIGLVCLWSVVAWTACKLATCLRDIAWAAAMPEFANTHISAHAHFLVDR